LLIRLYPSHDWRKNLAKLNKKIDMVNKEEKSFEMRPVTEKEWWIFHALIINSADLGNTNLYPTDYDIRVFPRYDHSTFMSETRFNKIRRIFEYAFYDLELSGSSQQDPWF
jgi:hypothetical protein